MNERETNPSVRSGRRHWNSEQRQQLLKQYRQSGMSRPVFCRKQGIGYSTLCAWLKKERASSAGRQGVEAVEVSPLAWMNEPVAAEIGLAGGMRLRLMKGCEDGLVVRLLEWVERCGR